MRCSADITEHFYELQQTFPREVRKKIAAAIALLEERGVLLGHPYSSDIKNAQPSLRELKISYMNHEWRILYKFNPSRNPVILHGGDKTGTEKSWYKLNVPIAARIYEDYMQNDYRGE